MYSRCFEIQDTSAVYSSDSVYRASWLCDTNGQWTNCSNRFSIGSVPMTTYFIWNICFCKGKPSEVLSSAENLLLSSIHSSQTSISTAQKSTVDIEEQVIQSETALQNEAEQRCTGKDCQERINTFTCSHIGLGTVKFEVWKRYFIAVGICLSFSIVVSVFLMQGKRSYKNQLETNFCLNS